MNALTSSERKVEQTRLLTELSRMLELIRRHQHEKTASSNEHMELEFRMMTDSVGVNNTNLAMISSLLSAMESMVKTDPSHWKKVFDAAFYTAYVDNIRRRIYYHTEKKVDGTVPTTHETVIKTPVLDNGEDVQFYVCCPNRPTNFRVTLSKERTIEPDASVLQHKALSFHQRRSFEHCIQGEFSQPASSIVVRYDITKVSKHGVNKKDIEGEARYHVEMELVTLPSWTDNAEERKEENWAWAKLLCQQYCTLMGPFDEAGQLLPPPELKLVSLK